MEDLKNSIVEYKKEYVDKCLELDKTRDDKIEEYSKLLEKPNLSNISFRIIKYRLFTAYEDHLHAIHELNAHYLRQINLLQPLIKRETNIDKTKYYEDQFDELY